MQLRQSISAAFFVLLLATTTGLVPFGHAAGPQGDLLAGGLLGSVGAAIGPDGALYVAEGAVGQIRRVSLANGSPSVFAANLPIQVIPLGGVIGVAFHGQTAYALVTLVHPFGAGVDGIYRIEADGSYTIIADLGAFSVANPPPPGFDYFVDSGLHFAIEAVDDGFLVSDGHLNRVLHVTLAGAIRVVEQFGNVAPAGLIEQDNVIYMAEVGPVPHDAGDGRIEAFSWFEPRLVAAGMPMIVDVAMGDQGRLFALSQGDFAGGNPGDPAAPDTGRLLEVRPDGTFRVLAEGIDRPSAVNVHGPHAIVVTLTGEVWRYPLPARRHRH